MELHDAATDAKEQRIAELEKELLKARSQLSDLQFELTRLRQAYRRALEQLQLIRRRMFLAKAERNETDKLQLRFEELLAEVEALEKQIEEKEKDLPASEDQDDDQDEGDGEAQDPAPGGEDKPKGKPDDKPKRKGRRKLSLSELPKVRVEITDPLLEGKVERIGFDEQSRLAFERGGHRHLIIATAVYKVEKPSEEPVCPSSDAPAEPEQGAAASTAVVLSTRRDTVLTLPEASHCEGGPSCNAFGACARALRKKAEAPPKAHLYLVAPKPLELLPKGLLAPSLIAHVLVSKYVMGTPFYRLESQMAFEGAPLDRGTMCRYGEHIGATLGAIVLAMRDHAMKTAFCLSTDATGALVQPEALGDGKHQKCKRGHFFVVLADRDHIFFEYEPKHTSAAVCSMFKGYKGYIQADASAVYDALFRGDATADKDSTGPPLEVGCWSHCRRKFWEAAVCKHPLGIEGLQKIDALFVAEGHLAKLPPSKRHQLRQKHIRPLLESFFRWVEDKQAEVLERGLMGSALGYAQRQKGPLTRFLDDGRLRMENNASERELRRIATGRKAWLFFGSDDHAEAAANLLSLVASCKLHGLDPEAYLAEVIHVMPYWPRDRYLELSPLYWTRTRARLDERELARDLGPITVPPALPPEEQPMPN